MPRGSLISPSLEHTLAVVRLALAAIFLGGEFLSDPTGVATLLAAAYAAVAFGAVFVLPADRVAAPPSALRLHVVDLAAVASLIVFSHDPLVHFLPIFSLATAAYRWGVRQTIVGGIVVVSALALGAEPGLRASAIEGTLPTHLVIVGGYTLAVAILVGHLAQRERRMRSDATAITRLLGRGGFRAGPVASLRAMLREVRSLFDARQVLLVVHDTAADTVYLWRTMPRAGTGRRPPTLQAIAGNDRQRYLFPVARTVDACLLRADEPRAVRLETALDERGLAVAAPVSCPAAFSAAHPAFRIYCLPNLAVDELQARLFVLDPVAEQPDQDLRLLQTLARRAAPIVHHLFLDRRLHASLLENERARVARELHDGVVQALIALEMRLDVAKRTIASSPRHAADEVTQVQQQLREQVVEIRSLMQRLRSPQVDQRRLIPFLSEITERFRVTTGIKARFVPAVEEVHLPSQVCHELARVANEALVNVRKHSGAQNVEVSLGTSRDAWTLSVEDDGRGFEFAGRLTGPALEFGEIGPVVIRERVRAIGGKLAIDSNPGHGARLEVMVPR
jgi:signal transduction histidine kinase